MKKSSIESEINQGLRFNDNFTQIPRINRKNKICGNKLYYYEKDYVRGYNLLKGNESETKWDQSCGINLEILSIFGCVNHKHTTK